MPVGPTNKNDPIGLFFSLSPDLLTKIDSTIIPCEICIRNLKNETKKLISFLVTDFGINNKSIYVYFSGNNGFHITALEKEYFNLDSKGRTELVEYLMGKNFSITSLGVTQYKNNVKVKIPISGLSYGWRKRISKNMKLYNITNNSLQKYVNRVGGYLLFLQPVPVVRAQPRLRYYAAASRAMRGLQLARRPRRLRDYTLGPQPADKEGQDPRRDARPVGRR